MLLRWLFGRKNSERIKDSLQQLLHFREVVRDTVRDEGVVIGLQKSLLLERFGYPLLQTEHPIAHESPDHIEPWGTARDNSISKQFTAKLTSLLGPDRTSLLDLGCSGGGQVRNFIENGYFAVGLEGSDLSLRTLRAEWLTIPEFLFTADITKPFKLYNQANDETLKFGAITLWEVIEHIHEDDLRPLMKNLNEHLLPGGIIIMSVSPNEEVINGVRLHQTVHEKQWWLKTFSELGWNHNEAIINYFGANLVRCDTLEGNAPGSFHVALSRKDEEAFISKRVSPQFK